MKRLLPILLLVFSVGVGAPINASERRIEVACPLGGRNAQGIEVLGSYLQDIGLDGRRYGAHVEPNPPPECPDNGFFVYKEKFSETELAQLKQYIFSDEYQSMRRNAAPPHYRLAKISEHMGMPPVPLDYLIATWEVPQGNEDLYLYYAHKAIAVIEVAISEMDLHAEVEKIVRHQYVLAELYRRVGNFDHARQQLDRVKQTDHNQVVFKPVFIDYLDYLISNKDSDSHKMSEAEEVLGSYSGTEDVGGGANLSWERSWQKLVRTGSCTFCDLRNAYLVSENLAGVNLDGADLTGARLIYANLTGAKLYGADLTGATLIYANLTGANLSRANLEGASLASANLTGARLTDANLYGANLTDANLNDANLSSANLTKAVLEGAQLVGANLQQANLSTNTTHAIFCRTIMTDGSTNNSGC